MKLFLALVFSFILCTTALGDYASDMKAASVEGKTWIVIVTNPPSCIWCRDLEAKFKDLEKAHKLNDVIITKLHPNDPIVALMNKELANEDKIAMIPDWVIYKYTNGKFEYVNRIKGSISKDQILREIGR